MCISCVLTRSRVDGAPEMAQESVFRASGFTLVEVVMVRVLLSCSEIVALEKILVR